jgi:hypothetical protein
MRKLKPISAFFVLTFFLGLCCSPTAYATGEYGPNLVFNGDFSLGNTGFDTDYSFVGPGGSLTPEGTYTVANNPNDFHGNFQGTPYVGDYFLIVNGATNSEICPEDPGNCDQYWVVWEQTITGVETGKQYEFGFMLSSMVTQSPANLEITVEINGMVATQVEVAPGATNEWVPVVWTNADKSNQATITIIETSKVAMGNDFGIDDIMFREVITCPPMDEVVTITTTDVSCHGEMDGEIFVTMDGAKPFNICISYGCVPDDNGEWNTLKTQTSHYTGLKPGWWLITIIDANGCEYVACVEIGEPGPLGAHVTELQNPLCAGDENGVAVIEITGGTPPFTASTGTIDGNILTIDGLADGDYMVEINDANSCGPVFVEFSMEEPEVLTAEYEIISHVSCFGGADGMVEITIEGGTPPYSTDFDGDLEALTAGDYVIEVTDANGCGPVVLEFTIEQPEMLEASVEVISHVSCYGGDDGVAVLTITGGTEPYAIDFGYEWDALAAGEYTVVVNDANECGPITIEFTIEQPDLLEASVEVISHVNCYGGDDGVAVLTITGGTEPYAIDFGYEWDALAAGVYTVVVNDANECGPITIEFTIEQPDLLEASVEVISHVSCFGGSNGVAELTITGGTEPYAIDFGYEWDALAAGVYTVVVNDAKECGPITIEFTIEQPDLLEASVEVISHVSCFGGSDGVAELTITGGTGPYTIDFANDWDNLAAGDYVVVVDDANECGPITIEFTIEQPDLLEASVELISHVSCYGGSDGVAELTITGGTEPYVIDFDYVWDALAAGEYTVVVNDANECGPITIEFTIEQPDLLEASVEVISHVSCFGGSDGMAELTITGGVEPYEVDFDYDWNALMAGTYTVYVTDANDCEVEVTFEITQPAEISINYEVTHVSCNGGDDGAIWVSVGGGTGNLQICIFPGCIELEDCDEQIIPDKGTATYGGLPAGWYTIAVVDENGCLVYVCVEIEEPDAIMAEIEYDPIECYGGSTDVLVTGEGGTGDLTLYAVDGENLIPVGVLPQTVTVSAGPFVWVVKDENDCEFPIEYNMEQPDAIMAEISYDPIDCYGGSTDVLVTGEGGTGDLTLYAVDGEDLILVGVLPQTVTVTAGPFEWVVMDENDCEFPIEYNMVQPEELLAEPVFEPIACNGGTTLVDVDADGGTGTLSLYKMVEGELEFVSNLPLAEPIELGAGEYHWVVIDENDCDVHLEFEITEPDAIMAEIEYDPIDCYGGSTDVLVTGEGGTGDLTLYTVDGDDLILVGVLPQTVTITAGNVNWVVIDENECEFPIVYTFTQPAELVAMVADGGITNVTCFGGADGSALIEISGGTPPYFYNSVEVDGNYLLIENLNAGTYTVEITDSKNCGPAAVTFTIEDGPEIIVTLEGVIDILCYGDETGIIEVSASGGNGGFMYSLDGETWQNNGVFEGLAAGEYTVYVEDAEGCTAMLEGIVVDQPDELVVTLDVIDVTCFGANDGQIIGYITGGVGPYSVCLFTECVPVEDCDDCDPEKSQGFAHWNLVPGEYMIVVTDQNGCQWIECVTIGEPEPLVAFIDEWTDVDCHGEATGEATVKVMGGNGGYEFLWSDGQTTQTAVDLVAGTYTVTVTDEKGCETTAEVTITEPAMPLSVGVEHGNVSCAGEEDGFIILSPEGGVGEYGVSGDIGGLFVQGLGAGTYEFTVTDANGCTVTETVTITEPEALTLELEVTNLECEGVGEVAYVSDWVWYRQGLTKAGNMPDADRSDPDVVIGEPEYGDVPGTFFSLGFGGEMIVKFDAPIVNGPGNDLMIVETTFGNHTCETYPEKVDVWVAQYIDESLFIPVQEELDVLTLADWVYLGQGCLDSEFDLGDLPWAQYVYMRDVSNPNDFPNSQQSDGYDINGLVALHGTVVASADVEAIVGGGTAPYTFLWSNGQTTAKIEGVGPGTYTVVVTDANGCEIEGSIVVECDEVKIVPGSNPLTDGNLVNAGDDNITLRAFPNPFHTETNIEFELQESAYVILEVYNLVGERVATLFEGQVDAFAPHKVTLRAGSLPNGIYFYRLSDGRNTYFNKLILAR